MAINPTDILNLTVNAGGRISVNDVEMANVEAMTAQLQEAAAWTPQPALHVFPKSGRGEWSVEYYFIGKVIYTAHRVGFIDPQFTFYNEDGTVMEKKLQEPGQLDG
jgi:biopolymer transport protein ExbD